MNQWIKCRDELPPEETHVLCWAVSEDGVGVFMGEPIKWEGSVFWDFLNIGEDHGLKVTHWMPLPEPPWD